jgi:poly[(R)-3-hydroxyalkanoate] polymerase subunit PhaC
MILHSQVIEQAVDVGERGLFVKELVLARGPMPIALVRKRAAVGGGSAGSDPRDLAKPTRAPLLLIHGYGQNRHAFHLPSRSMVNHLARAGFDVFNVDLRGRGRSAHLGARRPRSVLDFIQEDVPTALDEIRKLIGDQPVYLIGHSLGGVVAYCAAVDQKERVAGVATLGAPYYFARGSRWLGALGNLFLELDRHFQFPNVAVPTRAYGKFVRSAQRIVESRLYPLPFRGFRRGATEPEILSEHMALAMERGSIATMRGMFAWAADAAKGSGADGLFGYAERFESLNIPLLIVAGKHDDLAAPASVRPAFERSRSRDKTYRELPFGHVDLLIGHDAPLLTWPLLESWLGRRAERAELRA